MSSNSIMVKGGYRFDVSDVALIVNKVKIANNKKLGTYKTLTM